jgi:IS605 OrfB family transposase
MSIKTIHCRLVASEPVRRHLWHLMAQNNTPLVNDLLKQVSQHPDFVTWQRRGTVPDTVVRTLCEPLKAVYPGQPGRFYASAVLMVTYIYKSWLALQQNRRRRLDGKQRWLNVVKSDAELLELSGSTLEAIQQRAQAILSQLTVEENQANPQAEKRGTARRKANSSNQNASLIARLFAAYEATDDHMSRCAIAYLIKNGGEIPATEEDPEKFAHRVHRKQKEIERLEEQLQARLPKGRDLTGEEFLETLAIAQHQILETVAQAREWQDKLLTRPAALPYPIIYGSATDVRWGKTEQGRIAVNFNGLEKYFKAADSEIKAYFKAHPEHPFRLYCDQRQLPFFQRFLADSQAYQASPSTYPAGLLTLSSAILAWREGEGNGDPWTVNHLALYCTFDTRLMTAEGTLEIQQEKSDKALKKLTHANPDPRHQATLNRLINLPERPSQKSYPGKPEILVGLSMGLANPITAVVVNGDTGDVLAYRTPRTLLGDRYHLLDQQRQQQRENALRRYKNQKRGVTNQPSESELGQYVDRLLAKSIIQLAQSYQAGSIVIPNLTHRRELLASEMTAKAERKSSSVAVQKQYAKEYRKAIHRWSYNRLIEAIWCKAQQLGIKVESEFQSTQGHPQEQAKDLAIAAYHARAIPKK